MAISSDYILVDISSGVTIPPESAVIVPEVLGGYAYEVLEDSDAAIEYGEGQGILFDEPGSPGIPVDSENIDDQAYWVINIDNGYVGMAPNMRLIPYVDDVDEIDVNEVRRSGMVPVMPDAVRDLEGLPFESVTND